MPSYLIQFKSGFECLNQYACLETAVRAHSGAQMITQLTDAEADAWQEGRVVDTARIWAEPVRPQICGPFFPL